MRYFFTLHMIEHGTLFDYMTWPHLSDGLEGMAFGSGYFEIALISGSFNTVFF